MILTAKEDDEINGYASDDAEDDAGNADEDDGEHAGYDTQDEDEVDDENNEAVMARKSREKDCEEEATRYVHINYN